MKNTFKKAYITLVCFIMIFLCLWLSGCDKNPTDNQKTDNTSTVEIDKKFLSIIKNETAFVSEDGQSLYLKDFIYASDETTDYYAKPQEYVILDLDSDGSDELVVDITPNQVYYMVFHENDNNIYGFLIGRRSLQSLKEDGSFTGTSGANINYYRKMKFEGNTYKIINTAIKNEADNIFEIDGKEATVEAVNEYIEKWNSKKDAVWTKIS